MSGSDEELETFLKAKAFVISAREKGQALEQALAAAKKELHTSHAKYCTEIAELQQLLSAQKQRAGELQEAALQREESARELKAQLQAKDAQIQELTATVSKLKETSAEKSNTAARKKALAELNKLLSTTPEPGSSGAPASPAHGQGVPPEPLSSGSPANGQGVPASPASSAVAGEEHTTSSVDTTAAASLADGTSGALRLESSGAAASSASTDAVGAARHAAPSGHPPTPAVARSAQHNPSHAHSNSATQASTDAARLPDWAAQLPVKQQREMLQLPSTLDLRHKAKRGRANFGIKYTKWDEKQQGLARWVCNMNMHNFPSSHAAAQNILSVPPRAPGTLSLKKSVGESLFIVLLQLDYMRVQQNDVPRDPAPTPTSQEAIEAQAALLKQQQQAVAMGMLATPDGTAAVSWVTYTSWDIWHAFLRYTGCVLAPPNGKPRTDVRRELKWHGPTPQAMGSAAKRRSVPCTFSNWRAVYDLALQDAVPNQQNGAAAPLPQSTPQGQHGSSAARGVKRPAEGLLHGAAPAPKRAAMAAAEEVSSVHTSAAAASSSSAAGGWAAVAALDE